MDQHGLGKGDLRAELGFLRKNEGFTQARLERATSVQEVLQENSDESFERSRSRFVSAVHSLDSSEAALLLDIFAFSPETADKATLRDRRAVHAKTISRGIDTVSAREAVALDHLTTRLVTGRFAQSPVTLHVPEMHRGIVYETTSTLVIVENRRWKETWEHYRFVAAFDEMDFLTITRSYEARASTPSSGRFRVNTRPTSRGYNDHFWHRDRARELDEPMRRGEAYDLRFKLEPPETSELSPIKLVARAFHERSLLASIQVRFIGEWPAVIWTHERVSFFDSPGESNDTNRIYRVDADGTASLRLRDAQGGLFSGVAWEWE